MEFKTDLNYKPDFPEFEVIQRAFFKCPHCEKICEKLMSKHKVDYALAFDKLQQRHMEYVGAVNEMIRVIGSDIGTMVSMASQEIIRDGVRTLRKNLANDRK